MAIMVDDTAQVNVNVEQYENFDNYQSYMNGNLIRNGPVLELVNLERNSHSFIKTPMTMIDFDLKFKINMTNWDNCIPPADPGYCGGSIFMGPAVRTDPGNYYPGAGEGIDCLCLLFRTFNSYPDNPHWRIRLRNALFGWNTEYGVGLEMYWEGQLNKDYFIRFWRETINGISTAYCGIYDDYDCTVISADANNYTNPSNLVLMEADGVTPNTRSYNQFQAMGSYGASEPAGFLADGILSDYRLTIQ